MKYLVILICLAALISCNKEDNFSSSIDVESQILVHNEVFVNEVSYSGNFWVVLYKDSDNSIIGNLQAFPGKYFDFAIRIDSGVTVSDQEFLRLALHEDNGTIGEFEYNGAGGNDQLLVLNGNAMEKRFFIREPFLQINDQAIVNDSIRVDSVITGVNSWISVFTVNNTGQPDSQVGLVYVPGGISKNFKIKLTDATLQAGTNLLARLHLDTTPYESFSSADIVEIFNTDTIKQTITLQ